MTYDTIESLKHGMTTIEMVSKIKDVQHHWNIFFVTAQLKTSALQSGRSLWSIIGDCKLPLGLYLPFSIVHLLRDYESLYVS